MSSLLVFNSVYRLEWRYSQSCLYFLPSFVNYCPSNLLQSQSTIFTDSVWLGVGWGAGLFSCVGDNFFQEFNTVFLTRFRTYKNCFTTPNKNLGGEEVSDI
jgi:hypothetical protein